MTAAIPAISLAVVLILITAGYAVLSAQSERRSFQEAGASAGLYPTRSGKDLRRSYDFPLMHKGRPRRCDDALSANMEGRTAWIARYSFHHWAPPLINARRHFVIVIMDLRSQIPQICIEPPTFWGDARYGLGMSDCTTESDDFNLLFRVSSADAEAASWLLSPTMMSWLSANGQGCGFEINANGLLVHFGSELEPASPIAVKSITTGFVRAIPDEVRSRYDFDDASTHSSSSRQQR